MHNSAFFYFLHCFSGWMLVRRLRPTIIYKLLKNYRGDFIPLVCKLFGVWSLSRDPPIMLIILPIMLCCTAQKLPIMLKFIFNTYLLCSNYAQLFMPQFSCFANNFINNKWLKHKLTCQNAYHRNDRYTLIEQSAM